VDWLNEWKRGFLKNGWKEDDKCKGLDYWIEEGYTLELVADKLTYPSAIVIDDEGELFIGEAGFSYGPAAADPRNIHIRKDGSRRVIAADFGRPLTGLAWHKGFFYVFCRRNCYKYFRCGKRQLSDGLAWQEQELS
jgi:hypothetical protein